MRTRLAAFWEYLRSSYWFIPSVMCAAAILLVVVLLNLEDTLIEGTPTGLWWLYAGSPSGAREVLSTIAGSMITVASLTFSVTMVALSVASQQFGPRLLRSFMRDRGVQFVLGTFLATFLFSLLTLRRVREINNEGDVPYVSVTVALALTILSIGVLIYFIHHVSRMMQSSNLIAAVSRDIHEAIQKIFPKRVGAERPEEPEHVHQSRVPENLEAESRPVPARKNGYLQAIEKDALLKTATQRQVLVRLCFRPGDYIVKGSPLVLVWPGRSVDEDLCGALNESFVIGVERTVTQDLRYTVDQLVEIALRALSTGIDDPFTAIACLDHLTAALCHLAEREIPSGYRYDAEQRLRIIADPVTFTDITDAIFNPIREAGKKKTAVTLAALRVIEVASGRVRREADKHALFHHAALLEKESKEALTSDADRQLIAERFRQAVRLLA